MDGYYESRLKAQTVLLGLQLKALENTLVKVRDGVVPANKRREVIDQTLAYNQTLGRDFEERWPQEERPK